ncbi:hypothetical protein I3843_06G058000 [Carya illinoinensis]|nr:hypothetical protein I3843_06G058000 [Carya illinoinensis]
MRRKGTWFWKKVHSCIPEVLSRFKWKIWQGNVSFWWDKWLEDGPLRVLHENVVCPSLKVKYFWVDNEWDRDMLIQLIGEEKVFEVLGVLRKYRTVEDVLVWPANASGQFTTKSAWSCIRVWAPLVRWADWMWHSCLSKNISVTMWRAFTNSLSIDAKLRLLLDRWL